MVTAILGILGSILGIFATWYIGKVTVKWIQAYRNREETAQVSDAKIQVQGDNQAENLESDKLKAIEGR